MFGGLGNRFTPNKSTWEWTGQRWSLVATDASEEHFGSALPNTSTFGSNLHQLIAVSRNSHGQFDTWIWRGTHWLRSSVRTLALASPDPWNGQLIGIVYDTNIGSDILVSCEFDEPLNSTTVYGWSKSGWRKLTGPQPGPCAPSSRIAFDSGSRDLVVFSHGKTWLWKGKTWILAPLAMEPPALSKFTMCNDSYSNEVVLYGGELTLPRLNFTDTWIWRGNKWALLNLSVHPPPLLYATCGYDPIRRSVVLYGGNAQGVKRFYTSTQTWFWNGSSWST